MCAAVQTAHTIQRTPADATHRTNHVLPRSTHHEIGKNLRGTPQGHASVHHTHRQHGIRRPSSCGCSTVESEGARRPESPVHTVGWPVVIGGVADHSACVGGQLLDGQNQEPLLCGGARASCAAIYSEMKPLHVRHASDNMSPGKPYDLPRSASVVHCSTLHWTRPW